MKTEASAQSTCVIWIDHPNRIVSFQSAGEKKAAFPDEKEWLLSEIVTTLFFWADKFEKRFQHNA